MLSETLAAGLLHYEIGPKIRALRLKKKLWLVQLGAHTDLSAGLLSKIERGQLFPTLPTLLRIALVFGAGLEHFFVDSRDLSFPKIPSGLDSHRARRFTHQANAPLVHCYGPWGSLFARKFSLLWRPGNSVRNQLNFLPKAGAPQSSRSQKAAKFPVFSP
jgi:transcriptional regulator with XRE-family HTH domain